MKRCGICSFFFSNNGNVVGLYTVYQHGSCQSAEVEYRAEL
jgi:hypothetical protein